MPSDIGLGDADPRFELPAGDEPDAGSGDDAGTLVDAGAPETCESLSDWDREATRFEDEVVELTNRARASGQDCGEEGMFAPAGPVTMEPRLRCAARLHARYMARAEDDFGHESRAGTTPASRVQAAGYAYAMLGENLGVGPATPKDIVAAWVASDGHCKVLMQPAFTEVGIGYVYGRWETDMEVGVIGAPYWAQDFGLPDQQGQSK